MPDIATQVTAIQTAIGTYSTAAIGLALVSVGVGVAVAWLRKSGKFAK